MTHFIAVHLLSPRLLIKLWDTNFPVYICHLRQILMEYVATCNTFHSECTQRSKMLFSCHTIFKNVLQKKKRKEIMSVVSISWRHDCAKMFHRHFPTLDETCVAIDMTHNTPLQCNSRKLSHCIDTLELLYKINV